MDLGPIDPLRLIDRPMPSDGYAYRYKAEGVIEIDLPEGPVHVRPGAPLRGLDGEVIGQVTAAAVRDGCLTVEMVYRPRVPLGHIEVSFVVPDA